MAVDLADFDIDAYVTSAGRGDAASAWEIVESALATNAAPIVLRDLLAEALTVIGLRWQDGRWTIRDEHTATAVTKRLLRRIDQLATAASQRTGMTVLAAAEGDWHTMGTLLLATALRHDGWSVITLPAGTSSGQLASTIHDHGPVVVAITCSMPALLPGARRLVMASQDAGTPAVVGGRGLGNDVTRARRIGANGWARDVVDASATLAAHAGFSGPSLRIEHDAIGEYATLRRSVSAITTQIEDAVQERLDGDAEMHVGIALWILRSVASSLLCADPTIVEGDVAWCRARSQAGGPQVAPVLQVVHDALPSHLVQARGLIAAVMG